MVERSYNVAGFKSAYIMEFESIGEFVNYIENTPVNSVFTSNNRQSQYTYEWFKDFSGTKNFDEAKLLVLNGWDDGAKKLNDRLEVEKKLVNGMKNITAFDVVGFQASVPRYLQGIPTNMINKRKVPCKQKVVTLTKLISYPSRTPAKDIERESVLTLQIAKKLEQQGVRTNINIFRIGSDHRGNVIGLKVKIKNASERLNISKMAFPLAHPSMLRRLCFRFTEVYDKVTSGFSCYGTPLFENEISEFKENNEYIIPQFMSKAIKSRGGIEGIKTTEEMLNYFK